jgi:hypothetical protein
MMRITPLALALCLAAATADAMSVRLASLEEVTDSAATIVHGTVREVRSGRDQRGAPATWVTLDVIGTLKGGPHRETTFKQLGAPLSSRSSSAGRPLIGFPGYRAGEEVVLFLHAESVLGFTSPVGGSQGVYRVERGSDRSRVRRELQAEGPAEDLDELLGRVARLVRGAK